MSEKINLHPQPITPYKPSPGELGKGREKRGQSFDKALEKALKEQGEITFSAHALERLRQRDLAIDAAELAQIDEAVDKARKKGVHSSLVLLGDVAMVASVKNNTIITAVDRQGMKDHVFTGIDGAVIIK